MSCVRRLFMACPQVRFDWSIFTQAGDLLQCRGPQRAGDLGLRTEVERSPRAGHFSLRAEVDKSR
jgi:hypothetical protein